jgi:hypothetical protein
MVVPKNNHITNYILNTTLMRKFIMLLSFLAFATPAFAETAPVSSAVTTSQVVVEGAVGTLSYVPQGISRGHCLSQSVTSFAAVKTSASSDGNLSDVKSSAIGGGIAKTSNKNLGGASYFGSSTIVLVPVAHSHNDH